MLGVLRWIGKLLLLALSLVLLENSIWGIPESVTSQWTFLASLNAYVPARVSIGVVLGLLMVAAAVGPKTLRAWHDSIFNWWSADALLQEENERLRRDKEELERRLAAHEGRDPQKVIVATYEGRTPPKVVAEVEREGPIDFSFAAPANAFVVLAGGLGPAPGHYPVPYTAKAPAAAFEVEGPEATYRVALAYEVRVFDDAPEGSEPEGSQPDLPHPVRTVQTTTHIEVLDGSENVVRYPTVYTGRARVSKDGSVRYVVTSDWNLEALAEGDYALNVYDCAEGMGVGSSVYMSTIRREYRNMRLTVSKLAA